MTLRVSLETMFQAFISSAAGDVKVMEVSTVVRIRPLFGGSMLRKRRRERKMGGTDVKLPSFFDVFVVVYSLLPFL